MHVQVKEECSACWGWGALGLEGMADLLTQMEGVGERGGGGREGERLG